MFTQYATAFGKISNMMFVNLTYAVLCIILAIASMVIGYKIFDRITPFNTGDLLSKSPIAVGIFFGAIMLGIGICSGVVIGLACN